MTFVIDYHSDETRSAGDSPYVQYADAETAFRRMIRDHPNAETRLIAWDQSGPATLLMHYDPCADTPHRWQDSLTGLSPDPLRRAAQIGLAAICLSLDSESCDEMADTLSEARDALLGVLK